MDLVDGRYQHGTRTCYIQGKCRCDACRQANAKYAAAWKARNLEKVEAAQNAWQERNPGVAKARTRAHYWANREGKLAYQKTYREANLDEIRARDQAYYLANRERLLAYIRNYRLTNPSRPEVRKAIKGRRRQAELVSMDAMDRMLSVAYRVAIRDDQCTYCGGIGEEDDHVVPLKRGGTDHWWNLTRACAPCNRSKGSKLLEEWPGCPELIESQA